MGVDTNVYEGYGIAITTKGLSKKNTDMLNNNQIPLQDCYCDKGWVFINLGAKKIKSLECEINDNNKEVSSSLTLLEQNKDDKKKALEEYSKEYHKEEYNEENSYENLKKFLEEHPDSWISGKYLVIYYS